MLLKNEKYSNIEQNFLYKMTADSHIEENIHDADCDIDHYSNVYIHTDENSCWVSCWDTGVSDKRKPLQEFEAFGKSRTPFLRLLALVDNLKPLLGYMEMNDSTILEENTTFDFNFLLEYGEGKENEGMVDCGRKEIKV